MGLTFEISRRPQARDVVFTGVASRQEIGKYTMRTDSFINAVELDNMPVSVIEAFGAGTPV